MAKKVLITGGSTRTMIDKVRAVTNIFSGRTGANISKYFQENGYDVTFITSNPLVVEGFTGNLISYNTFDELYDLMQNEICNNSYDIIIHSAAVSDYKCSAVCVFDENKDFVELDSSGKIASNNKELYLKMTPTVKIIDKIRGWGFTGKLIKFKLQVDISDEELLSIARKSRTHSNADIIVANCLEWATKRAYIIDDKNERSIERSELAKVLFDIVG